MSETNNDFDADGIPDEIDPDMDGDGIPNETDPYPNDPTNSGPNTSVCFLQNTIIRTDQGFIKIQDINGSHTINNHKCIGLSYGYFTGDTIVHIPKNSLGENIPNKDTFVTPCHMIRVQDKKKPIIARQLANIIKDVECIPYTRTMGMVYNPLFNEWLFIDANNMSAETLHPNFNRSYAHVIMFDKIKLQKKVYQNKNKIFV